MAEFVVEEKSELGESLALKIEQFCPATAPIIDEHKYKEQKLICWLIMFMVES
jgi:hypothetical protein